MTTAEKHSRIIVVGGHTRSIGKTQLVCDIVAALPEANWIAGKITQYGHGFCVKKGKHCDCAPAEHVVALSWEDGTNPRTDSGRFLPAGAKRSFWLRTKQGYLGEGMPLLRSALRECENGDGQPLNVVLESNTLLDFVSPSLYLVVLDPSKADFKQSAQALLDRASAFVLREPLPLNDATRLPAGRWPEIQSGLLARKPAFLQRQGEPLPQPLCQRIAAVLHQPASIAV
jgi:hypothetical protein